MWGRVFCVFWVCDDEVQFQVKATIVASQHKPCLAIEYWVQQRGVGCDSTMLGIAHDVAHPGTPYAPRALKHSGHAQPHAHTRYVSHSSPKLTRFLSLDHHILRLRNTPRAHPARTPCVCRTAPADVGAPTSTDLQYGVSAVQGPRELMEDCASVVPNGKCGYLYACRSSGTACVHMETALCASCAWQSVCLYTFAVSGSFTP